MPKSLSLSLSLSRPGARVRRVPPVVWMRRYNLLPARIGEALICCPSAVDVALESWGSKPP
jgi:hypothetical protein